VSRPAWAGEACALKACRWLACCFKSRSTTDAQIVGCGALTPIVEGVFGFTRPALSLETSLGGRDRLGSAAALCFFGDSHTRNLVNSVLELLRKENGRPVSMVSETEEAQGSKKLLPSDRSHVLASRVRYFRVRFVNDWSPTCATLRQ